MRTIELLEQYGNKMSAPESKKIGKHLFELRIQGNLKIRMLYTFHNNQAYVLHGFIKKTSKIPLKEMEIVIKRLRILIANV